MMHFPVCMVNNEIVALDPYLNILILQFSVLNCTEQVLFWRGKIHAVSRQNGFSDTIL